MAQFSGLAGAQCRNPKDQELRIDFLTSQARSSQPVSMPELNLALQPLKFMEFSLVQTTQTCLPSTLGACIVNVPAPYRYAVHKLIVYGERPEQQRTKSIKDLLQAASLIDYYLKTDQAETFIDPATNG